MIPDRLGWYKTAFTHASVSAEAGFNNERLELIGDAVYDVVVSEYLYFRYPFKDEGFLTEMRSKMVSRRTVNQLAQNMGLQHYLESTLTNKNLLNSSTLGNAFEALIGAIYFDRGFRSARWFIRNKVIKAHFDISDLEEVTMNFKSKIIHYAQKNGIPFEYRMLNEEQTRQGKQYTMGLYLKGEMVAKHTAFNKKAAEQEASRIALEKLGIE